MERLPRRTFTPAFKAQVVLELLSEQRSSAELCREFLLSPPFSRVGRTRPEAACPPSSRRRSVPSGLGCGPSG
jgi:transposase-like protein